MHKWISKSNKQEHILAIINKITNWTLVKVRKAHRIYTTQILYCLKAVKENIYCVIRNPLSLLT